MGLSAIAGLSCFFWNQWVIYSNNCYNTKKSWNTCKLQRTSL